MAETTEVQIFIEANSQFEGIRSIWKWNPNLGSSGNWQVYPQTDNYPLLNEIIPGEGYWIQTRENDEFTEGLVAYYPFNGNANDESGNRNHGIVQGASLTTDITHTTNRAYNFDGEDFILVPDAPDLHFTQNDSFTVSFWIRMKGNTSGFLFAKYRTDSTPTALSFFSQFVSSKFLFILDSAHVDQQFAQTRSITDIEGEWHHIVTTYENKIMKIYLDGEIGGSNTNTLDSGDTFPAGPLIIGALSYEGTIGSFLNAALDQFRLYNRALSGEEIQALYEFENAQ
ncbi:MAG: LamG domain-containing protein [SAR324 cluster bacterium]|nr:LamG domain-containing protein [SAR324 cluster bacterium]